MAVPKRRVSKTRAAKRRTHYKVTLAVPVRDKDGTWKMSHHRNKFNGACLLYTSDAADDSIRV